MLKKVPIKTARTKQALRWLASGDTNPSASGPATNAPNVLILTFRILLAWYSRQVGCFPRN